MMQSPASQPSPPPGELCSQGPPLLAFLQPLAAGLGPGDWPPAKALLGLPPPLLGLAGVLGPLSRSCPPLTMLLCLSYLSLLQEPSGLGKILEGSLACLMSAAPLT